MLPCPDTRQSARRALHLAEAKSDEVPHQRELGRTQGATLGESSSPCDPPARCASWRSALSSRKKHSLRSTKFFDTRGRKLKKQTSEVVTMRINPLRIAGGKGTSVTPNPSFERTRSGRPLQAFISFSALRVQPPRADQLKHYASQRPGPQECGCGSP